jgi:hypothetical protein
MIPRIRSLDPRTLSSKIHPLEDKRKTLRRDWKQKGAIQEF